MGIVIVPELITLEKTGHTISKQETIQGNIFVLRDSSGYLIFETSVTGSDVAKVEACKSVAATSPPVIEK